MLRAIIIVGLTAMTIIFAVLYFFDDKVRSNLNDYNDLIDSGLIEKGWLPNFLPKSIRNISEEHDLDSNILIAKFVIDEGDTSSLERACRETDDNAGNIIFECEYEDSEIIIKIAPDGSGSLVSGLKKPHNKSINSQP